MPTLKDFLQGDKFAVNAGCELLEIREGYARGRMPVTPEHLNGGGVCQGGAMFTLADYVLAAAMNSHKQLTLSLNGTVYFYKSEKDGWLYAEAHELVDHRKVPYGEVSITNEDGVLVAKLTSQCYRKDVEIPCDELI